MNENIREQGISLRSLIKLAIKNIFSAIYFMIAGIIIALVYTQLLARPNYQASANIENRGAVSNQLMVTISTIATEDKTISGVVEKMDVTENDVPIKISEIKNGLTIGAYNTTTLKTTVTYVAADKDEVVVVLNLVIETSLERFFETNPSAVGKVQMQSDAIKISQTGLSKTIIYLAGIGLGAVFGLIIGVGRDLLNRRIISDADLEEYQTPFNVINLNRKTKEEGVLDSDKLKSAIPKLLEDLEELEKEIKVKIVGITNLGKKEIDGIIDNFGQERNEAWGKTLIIDLNIEEPFIQDIYDVNTEINITTILNKDNVLPVKVKDNLDVLPAVKHEYPARFLKEEQFSEIIKKYREEYEYIFIQLPAKEFYSAILFNLGLIDSLLINVSFDYTKMKVLDKYISGISEEHRKKIYISAIDSNIKKDYLTFLKRKAKTV